MTKTCWRMRVDTDGWIVDKEGIGSIASEEVQ